MSDEALTEFLHAVMPFCATLGIRGVTITADEVVMEMDWAAEHCTAGGVLHGGAIMSLADSCGAALAFANLPEGATGTTTVEGDVVDGGTSAALNMDGGTLGLGNGSSRPPLMSSPAARTDGDLARPATCSLLSCLVPIHNAPCTRCPTA